MIFTIIIKMIFSLIVLIFGWFKIPQLPELLQKNLDDLIQFFVNPIEVFKQFLGNEFFNVVVILIIAYMLLSPLVHISLWLYKRIRG